ncbi:MAG: hypothetical protein JHC83_05950, partial [Thermoleophilia bacterium]|nr:hypothetical protein [Thermoleophilia bacterium]
MQIKTILALAFAGLAVGAPLATAQDADDAKAIILTIDKTKPSSGQLMFTIEPEGFVYKKVPYAGGKNVAGTGHAHIYAKADGAKKAKYIGWTGSGVTSWTDKKMLKAGTTYRVYAVF